MFVHFFTNTGSFLRKPNTLICMMLIGFCVAVMILLSINSGTCISGSGNSTVEGNSVTGAVINININAAGASTSEGNRRKRNDTGSKAGPSSGKKKIKQGAPHVPAGLVGTKPYASLSNGSTAILPCHYTRSTYGVYWTKENGHSEPNGNTIVHLDTYFNVGERSGQGIDEGRFNISDDFSLIISPVMVKDEGRYSCKVSDVTTGRMIYLNSTNVTVFVYARKPYVNIKPCEHSVLVNQSEDLGQCTQFNVLDNQTSFQLNCSVEGAKPNVSLTWMSNKTNVGSNYALLSMFEDCGDGTFDQTLTLTGRVNETRNGTVFTCVAEGLAVDGVSNSSVTFLKAEHDHGQPDIPNTGQRPNVVAIAVTLVIACPMLIVSAVIMFVWKRKNKQENRSFQYQPPRDQASTEVNTTYHKTGNTHVCEDLEKQKDASTHLTQIDGEAIESKGESDAPSENRALEPDKGALLERKRRKIRNYLPNKPTTTNEATTHINIGVFGLTNAGKLSLINSLIFAQTGNYPTADAGATAANNQKYGGIETESKKLTDHMYFIKFKGMMNYELDHVSKFYRVIRPGKGTGNTPRDQIYCPIFILDYRHDSTRTEQCRNFMKAFSDDVRSHFGMGITVVVTKKKKLGGNDAIKEELNKATGVSKKRIWIFENYTCDNHEEDVERSMEFLDFISECLDVVKKNQEFISENRFP